LCAAAPFTRLVQISAASRTQQAVSGIALSTSLAGSNAIRSSTDDGRITGSAVDAGVLAWLRGRAGT
jgi:hypothetical protein